MSIETIDYNRNPYCFLVMYFYTQGMNLAECRQLLNNVLARQSGNVNISQLTTTAWSNQRNECISHF